MPQRFLRPGLTESDRWNACSFEAQSMYVRLLTLVDDFGRYDGRVAVLHAHCFALRPDIKPQRTAALRSELQKNELIDVYSVEGKEFIQVARWHERTRSEKSKYPDPQDSAAERRIPQGKDASLAPRPTSIVPSSNAISHKPFGDLLSRVRSLFKKRDSTPLDASETKAWRHAQESVAATSEKDWQLLEWLYAQRNGDSAKYRHQTMATLLNNWNGQIERARAWKNPSNVKSHQDEHQPKRGDNAFSAYG